jgi:hypothetical protein
LAGSLGIADGRYAVREAGADEGADPETPLVLVVETYGAPYPTRRRMRKAKAQAADAGGQTQVPVTRLMVVVASEIEDDPEAWLERVRKDETQRDDLVERGLACIRRAVAARRITATDPAIADPTAESMLAIRIGFGEGDELVERQWEQAIEVPRDAKRASRSEALRPQERMAALLGLRDTPLACEELVLRARADLSANRGREAALQLRVALEALLAERERLTGHGQEADLAALDKRRKATGEAANEALQGPPSADRASEVEQTLAICERVLRRRAAHGWDTG